MPKLTWTRVDKEIRSVDGLPVRLRKWLDVSGDRWVAQVPIEADPNYPDGWAWADAWTNDQPGSGYPERMNAGTRITDAVRDVEEHLEQILDYAAKQRSGWPLVDDAPSGKYIARYLADGRRVYASIEQSEPTPGEALVLTPGQPPRQVTIDHVTADDVAQRLAGVKAPTLDPYEVAGLRRPNANGWPATIQLSSVQFQALLALSDVAAEDVSEYAQPLREIHTILTNLDPRGH
ncbi:hypothetical protein ACFV9C_42355 [Kribbella sp. NPDC059898]|uniref:hypothetical protein n=1 Tax=Kribbella sp. NPDC059898 TaxID=3346995 RepID=UPI00364CCBBD